MKKRTWNLDLDPGNVFDEPFPTLAWLDLFRKVTALFYLYNQASKFGFMRYTRLPLFAWIPFSLISLLENAAKANSDSKINTWSIHWRIHWRCRKICCRKTL